MKGSVKLPVFIDDSRKLVNTTQLRAKYLGASYEAEYCQWQTLHGLGSLMETASLIITPNAYLEGKLLASYPPDPIGDFDVTRATTATRVNSAGLVELVPYNLLTYSEQFDNADWNKSSGTITANATTAPNVTTTADLFTANGVLGVHDFFQGFTGGSQTTASIYVKKNTAQYVYISLNYQGTGSDWATGIYNLDALTTATFQSGGVNNQVATISDMGNGWRRITLKVDTANTALFCMYGVADSMSPTFSSRGRVENSSSASFYAWGAQLNEGTIKPYQKTETRLNIPRLDHSNGTCPSILVEPQRTNLALWSSSFDNAAWGKVDTTITANTTISPSGVQDADTMTLTTPVSRIYQLTALGANTYTYSVWVKAVSGTPELRFLIGKDGTEVTQNMSVTTDWQRFEFTFSASIIVDYVVFINNNSSSGSVAIWGAQLEAGSYATSYIPTTSASVTRNADVISKTGISSLIGQTEGTLFVETKFTNVDSFSSYIGLTSGSFTNSIIIGKEAGVTPNKLILYIAANGSAILNNTTTALSSDYVKCAIAYKSGDWAAYVNGTLVASGTSTFSFSSSLDMFGIGANNGSLSQTFDKTQTKAAALWKTRLTNTQLAQLTTI